MTDLITAAVLTVSDRCSRGEAQDTSGPALVTILRDRLNIEVVNAAIVPDEADQIASQLRAWALLPEPVPDLVLTTGGTGLGPRDVTPEATLGVVERHCPALLELARQRCYAKTPLACLSRGEAGIVNRTLILNLPGSERGATETLEALLDVLPHAVAMLRGQSHDLNPKSQP